MAQTHHDHDHGYHYRYNHDSHHHDHDDDRHHHYHHYHHRHHHGYEHNHDHATPAGLTEGSKEHQDVHERVHVTDIQRRFAGREIINDQILLLGLTGGLIPYPTVIAVLLICTRLKASTLGATTVLCSSLGLILMLVAVGMGAAISVQQAAKRWSGSNTVARKAPYSSGVLIAIVSLYMGIYGYMGIVG